MFRVVLGLYWERQNSNVDRWFFWGGHFHFLNTYMLGNKEGKVATWTTLLKSRESAIAGLAGRSVAGSRREGGGAGGAGA